jgi:hypothetical protein
MNPLLREYLNLESVMLALDEFNEQLADRVRDAMDPVWHHMPPQDREWLNARELHWDAARGNISLPLSASLVCAPPRIEPAAVPADPIVDWRMVA